jgi:DNA primase
MEIAEIKQQLSIYTVLNHYGIKIDKNSMAKCPFHPDKTPSLQVYPKSNTYCCFSSNCSAGTGDQIQFIELKEAAGKHQAILRAKELLGATPDKTKVKENLNEVPALSLTEMFQKLKQNVNKNSKAKQYIESRNLTLQNLEVGFNANGYKDLPIGQAGLKNCIIFPLKDKRGNVVSLYGRSVITDKNGKHYYTANRKGLYPKYPPAETRKLILTESIIDAATLLQQKEIIAEYEILALYGTNGLTSEHTQAIRGLKHLKEIVLWLDGDQAGVKATEKYKTQIAELLNPKE